EVEHREHRLTAADDESFGIGLRRGGAERALGDPGVLRLVLTVDVDHPVRCPQPLAPIGFAGESGGRLGIGGPVAEAAVCRMILCGQVLAACAHTWALVSIASRMRATAAATGTPLSCSPDRKRKDTAPASRSSPPAMRVKGTVDFDALRIFLPERASLSSISTRTPAARSCAATSAR